MHDIKTLGELKASNYEALPVKAEIRKNLRKLLSEGKNVFEGIYGYDETVLPELQQAILAQHNIIFLGLRGQAKTKMARLLVQLLDEYIPAIKDTPLNEHPFAPISSSARELIEEMGDDTPIEWIHREDRYVEKLATPDVSVADLIGDMDPIKAANLGLSYSDERVIHYGLVPRANRSIFVINELPDLQARIQVALFNILEEGDLQIRGYKMRWPLDVLLVFTANPEDYTNRGSIITPLKDRIESQILTHYPTDLDIAMDITRNQVKLNPDQKENIEIPDLLSELLERVVMTARESEYVDEKSGISARMSIAAMEYLYAAIERRALAQKSDTATGRLTDIFKIVPAMTGKMELLYEGESMGPINLARMLIFEAIKEQFLSMFPSPEDVAQKEEERDIYDVFKLWFSDGNQVYLNLKAADEEYEKQLNKVPGLRKLAKSQAEEDAEVPFLMELLLFGMSFFEIIELAQESASFTAYDPLSGALNDF